MTSKNLRSKLKEYGATIGKDGRTLKLASINGGPEVEYKIALDGTISRRSRVGHAAAWSNWYLNTPDEMSRGVLAMWLSEPISMPKKR